MRSHCKEGMEGPKRVTADTIMPGFFKAAIPFSWGSSSYGDIAFQRQLPNQLASFL